MNLYKLAAHVIEALEAENIPYMVVGALRNRSASAVKRVDSRSSSSPSGRLTEQGKIEDALKGWTTKKMSTEISPSPDPASPDPPPAHPPPPGSH
jgi:hypothetical protein